MRVQLEARLSSLDHPKSSLESDVLNQPFTSALELLFPVRLPRDDTLIQRAEGLRLRRERALRC